MEVAVKLGTGVGELVGGGVGEANSIVGGIDVVLGIREGG
jgi:hypothetical protein